MLERLFALDKKKYGQYNDLEILPYLIDNGCTKCIMYGSGDMAVWFVDWLSNLYNIQPEFIIDTSPRVDRIEGVKVLDFVSFVPSPSDHFFVIIADEQYCDESFKKRLINQLKEKNAITIFNAHRVARPYWTSWYAYIKKNIVHFDRAYKLFIDEVSKNTFEEYLKTYITGERYLGITYPELYKYWGKDSDDHKLFDLKPDEVILNLGGSCGDTIFQYLKNGFPFKKIISVEADKTDFSYINRSISMIADDLKQKIQVDCYFIDENDYTIDLLYGNEHISLIEMDIEGAELPALRTGLETIKKERPILAISAYHKMDDLIKIPEFIHGNLSDYALALRKYPSTYYESFQCLQQINELVLYAIPKERYCGS